MLKMNKLTLIKYTIRNLVVRECLLKKEMECH